MKKIFTLLLSVLLALVMCFSVIACGDDTVNDNTDPNGPEINTPGENDGDGEGEDNQGEGDGDGEGDGEGGSDDRPAISDEIARKAAMAVRKLYESDSYVANLELGFDSKMREEKNYEYAVEKRGSKLAFTKPGEQTAYIIDVETGYMYIGSTAAGYVATPALPADTMGYFAYVLKQSAEANAPTTGVIPGTDAVQKPGNMPEISAQYDEDTKTLTVAIDAAEYVNSSLAPLYDAYKKNKTVRALLDEYVKSATGNKTTFTMLYEMLFLLAKTNAEMTFDQANGMLALIDPELDLYELLGEVIELNDELRTQVGARTLGEMLSGIYDYITAFIADPPTDGFDMESITRDVITAALITDTQASDDKIDEIKASIDLLLSTNIKNLVNSALAENPEALAAIASGVTLTTYTYDVTLKFDANDNVERLAVSLELEHSYTGETDGFRFLSDNEYKLDFDLEVSEYADTHDEFAGEITAVLGDLRPALIYGDITADVSVYVETAGEAMPTVVSVNYVYVDGDNNDAHSAQTTVVAIDDETNTVSLDAEFVNRVVSGANGKDVGFVVMLSDETALLIAYVDVDDAKDVATEIMKNIMQYLD